MHVDQYLNETMHPTNKFVVFSTQKQWIVNFIINIAEINVLYKLNCFSVCVCICMRVSHTTSTHHSPSVTIVIGNRNASKAINWPTIRSALFRNRTTPKQCNTPLRMWINKPKKMHLLAQLCYLYTINASYIHWNTQLRCVMRKFNHQT